MQNMDVPKLGHLNLLAVPILIAIIQSALG